MAAIDVVRKFFPGVTIVKDAMRNAVIVVTKNDANSKAVRKHDACAMAVACKRKFHLDGVIISRSVAYLVKGNTARRFKLPESISREVVSFDRGGGFAVGRYELSTMPPCSRLGVRPNRSGNRGIPGAIKRSRHITTNARAVLGGKKPLDE
jgi:hypothetical protein